MDLQTPVQSPDSFFETAAEDKENRQPVPEDSSVQGNKNHSEPGDVACDLCSRIFVSLDCLKAHIYEDHPDMQHHGEQQPPPDHFPQEGGQHPCETCHKHFISKDKLEEHCQEKHGEKAFSCPTCKKTFSRSHHLKIHMRSHTGDRYCPFCDELKGGKYPPSSVQYQLMSCGGKI